MSTTQSVYTFFSNEAKFAKKIIDKQRFFFYIINKLRIGKYPIVNNTGYIFCVFFFFCNVNEIVKKEDEYNYTYVFACSSKNVTYKYVGDAYLMKTNIFPVLLYTQKNKTCLNRRSGEMIFMLSG